MVLHGLPGRQDPVCRGFRRVWVPDAVLRVWAHWAFRQDGDRQALAPVWVPGQVLGLVSGLVQVLVLDRGAVVAEEAFWGAAEAVVVSCHAVVAEAVDDGHSRQAVYRRSKGLSLQARTAREETCVFP